MIWNRPRIALLALVASVYPSALVSTQELEAQEAEQVGEVVRLTAQVRDAWDRAELSGAVIVFTGMLGRYVTDLDGRAVMDLPSGRYWIAVRRWGYERLAGYLEVIRAGEMTVEMHRTRHVDLNAPGTLLVSVMNGESGDPMEGALVSLPDRESRATDEFGQAEFQNLQQHVVQFTVELSGYGTRTAPVALRPNRTTAARVEMTLETAAPRPIETEMRSLFMEARGIHDARARNAKRTHVLTRPMLDQLAVTQLTDALRTLPRVGVQDFASETPRLILGRCSLGLYVNGTRRSTDHPNVQRRFDIDGLRPESVELIELWEGRRSCGGTILIWTR